jgi:hypothetical protein
MALGAATVVAQPKKSFSAPLDLIRLSFAGDGAYPTGGTTGFNAYVQAVVGRAVQVAAVIKDGACGVYSPIYDAVNDKLYVEDAAGAEVAAQTDLSGTTFRLLVLAF